MDKQLVFTKTDLGRDALTSRPAGLGPRLRSLLIMVDGKRNLAEFDKLLGSDGAAAPLLEQLMAGGWVQPLGGAVVADAPASERAPASVPTLSEAIGSPPQQAASAVQVLPFAEARRLVVRFINDQLGPMGETLAIRIEGCKTAADLQASLPRLRDNLRNFKNAATVAQFDQEIAPQLPVS